MQTALCTFDSHTLFSIFADKVKFHEQMLEQVNDTEFSEEEQEDESLLENNILRRLYRVLTLPTPDMKLEDSKRLSTQAGDQDGEAIESDGEEGQGGAKVMDANLEVETEERERVATEEDDNKVGLNSVLYQSLYAESSRIRDCLLSITNKCQECSISNFAEHQGDFQKLLHPMRFQTHPMWRP